MPTIVTIIYFTLFNFQNVISYDYLSLFNNKWIAFKNHFKKVFTFSALSTTHSRHLISEGVNEINLLLGTYF